MTPVRAEVANLVHPDRPSVRVTLDAASLAVVTPSRWAALLAHLPPALVPSLDAAREAALALYR